MGGSWQGDESFEVVPNSEFVISRTAMRNNSSNYYINSKKSSFSEVTDLLKSKGVDLDNNRFLILQVNAFAAVLWLLWSMVAMTMSTMA